VLIAKMSCVDGYIRVTLDTYKLPTLRLIDY